VNPAFRFRPLLHAFLVLVTAVVLGAAVRGEQFTARLVALPM
jgi:hypothetical protein